jgi:hypothetical protein
VSAVELLDPTGERVPVDRPRAGRLETLEGRRVALLDISKPRGDIFLDRLESLLRGRRVEVERFRKPTYTKPAPADLRQQIRLQCEAVIEALAD